MKEARGVRARSHHIVPRQYLQKFANDSGQITVVRFGQQPYLESIRRTARENDFYTVHDHAGQPSDAVEVNLAKAESCFFDGVDAVGRQWPLEQDLRKRLARWIALQFLRTRMVRDMSRQLGALAVDIELSPARRQSQLDSLLRQNPEMDPKVIGPRLVSALDEVGAAARSRAGSALDHAQTIGRYREEFSDALLKRRWLLYLFARRSIITSDNPVGFSSPTPGTVGIMTAQAVIFPASRSSAVVMVDEPGPDVAALPTTQRALDINRVILSHARAAVYHHPADDPLRGLTLPSAPRRLPNVILGNASLQASES